MATTRPPLRHRARGNGDDTPPLRHRARGNGDETRGRRRIATPPPLPRWRRRGNHHAALGTERVAAFVFALSACVSLASLIDCAFVAPVVASTSASFRAAPPLDAELKGPRRDETMSRSGTTRSRTEKGRSTAVPPPVAPAPVVVSNDIIPGRLTEAEWLAMLDLEDGEMYVRDLLEELLECTMEECHKIYIQRQ
ncbi:uncharacterized protein C2orf81 homolog [Lampetra fluviatilis]